jgi:hypothetical protein
MPDIRGSIKKIIPEKKRPSTPIKNTVTMPSFNPEDVFLLPEDKYISSPNISYSMPSPIIPSATPPQATPQTNVIRNASLQIVPEEPVSSDDDTNFLGSLIAQGVAGIGTGLMGGTPSDIQRSAGMFESMRSQQASRDRAKLLMDPKSEESRKRREVYKKLGYNVPDNFSYTDLNDPTVLQTLKGQMEQSRLAMPRQGGVSGAGKPKEEKPKERKLSQDERALLNNSALAYKALFDMEDAIKKNKSRTSYLGDNEYTYAANRFVEGIGRMQSGGAIGPDEVENFKKLIPGRFDSDELSKQKIKDMKAELESRLKSINYDPKEVLESRTPSIDFGSEE